VVIVVSLLSARLLSHQNKSKRMFTKKLGFLALENHGRFVLEQKKKACFQTHT